MAMFAAHAMCWDMAVAHEHLHPIRFVVSTSVAVVDPISGGRLNCNCPCVHVESVHEELLVKEAVDRRKLAAVPLGSPFTLCSDIASRAIGIYLRDCNITRFIRRMPLLEMGAVRVALRSRRRWF